MNKNVIKHARILFGQNFKTLRKEKELTQEDVAIFCGVTSEIVNKIEKGELACSMDFIIRLAVILDFKILLEAKVSSVQNRYLLQKSKRSGYFVVTDISHQVVCLFEAGNFNENQRFTFLNDNNNFSDMATILRELGEWLFKYHRDIF
jgi:transcriptional regulator with XRE-family HTH domain